MNYLLQVVFLIFKLQCIYVNVKTFCVVLFFVRPCVRARVCICVYALPTEKLTTKNVNHY